MDFGMGRDGYCEDERIIKGKLPFPSSSSSSSSPQYRGLVPGQYEAHDHQRGWLGNMFHHQENCPTPRSYDGAAAASRVEFMDVSPRNDDEDDDVRGRSGGGGETQAQTLSGGEIEIEHMFDKVVTPSDVGKLNRLVIPKQHAEKYFPLDSSTNEKGLLLNFEDRSGKPWRFRYSYWNSSQSYVMTKGWSRFVKDKKLDAGDIVSFQRGVGELGKDRLYIDWRRRPDAPDNTSLPHHFPYHRSVPWNPLFLQPTPAPVSFRDHHYAHMPPPVNNINFHPYNRNSYGYKNVVNMNPCPPGSIYYLRSTAPQDVGMVQMQQGGSGGGGGVRVGMGLETQPMVFESVPVVHGKAAAKRLRLFGVNMECPISDSDEHDILSSTTIPNVAMASSQQPTHHPLQLRLYNGTPVPSMPTDYLNKGKTSMSFDFNI